MIMDAALDVFSAHGFRGATVDQVAKAAGLSKPNLLYYFPSKEAIHADLMNQLLDTWLDPLKAMDSNGDPIEEILRYVMAKLWFSRDFPRQSRLFANEIVQGAPRMRTVLETDLKTLVDSKTQVIQTWMAEGKLAQVDPYHLIFSIWSLTQHYADFDTQVSAVLGRETPFDEAEVFLENLYRRMLTP
ncbi:MAG: TetR family transcriptional regulator C-terminal domain-containing protein [Planktomarina sp.]